MIFANSKKTNFIKFKQNKKDFIRKDKNKMFWYFFKIIFDNFYYIMLNIYIIREIILPLINHFFFDIDKKIWSTGILTQSWMKKK